MSDVIRFSRSLYAPEAVEAAVAAYSDFATIELATGSDDIVARVTEIDEEEAEEILDAFCNHVLFETIVRARGADSVFTSAG